MKNSPSPQNEPLLYKLYENLSDAFQDTVHVNNIWAHTHEPDCKHYAAAGHSIRWADMQ